MCLLRFLSSSTPLPEAVKVLCSGPQHHVLHWRKKKGIAHCGPRRPRCLILHFLVPSGPMSLMTSVTSDPHSLLTRVYFGKDQKYSAEGLAATHSGYDWHQPGQLYSRIHLEMSKCLVSVRSQPVRGLCPHLRLSTRSFLHTLSLSCCILGNP